MYKILKKKKKSSPLFLIVKKGDLNVKKYELVEGKRNLRESIIRMLLSFGFKDLSSYTSQT